MLVEQFFELRGPAPPGHTCTYITGCFHDKIICKENIRLDFYLHQKYCRRHIRVLYFPRPGPNHQQNLTPKCKILNVLWI